MSSGKSIVFSFVICSIIFIGIFIYFVSSISSTYPPIKEYGYTGTKTQFIISIREYADTDPKLTFKITDTTGNVNNDFAIYAIVEIGNIEYKLRCEDSQSGKKKTTIKVISAYDVDNKVGGYTKDAQGVDALLKRFELEILTPLNSDLGH